MMQLTSS